MMNVAVLKSILSLEIHYRSAPQAKVRNLKVQMVGSFHQCGGNIGAMTAGCWSDLEGRP